MLSDIESLDIMLRGNNPERDESEFSNSLRRSESPNYNTYANYDVNPHSKSREGEFRGYAGNGRFSGEVDLSSEIKRLSVKFDQRITQEISSVSRIYKEQ